MHAKQNVRLTRLTARFSLQIIQHFLEKQTHPFDQNPGLTESKTYQGVISKKRNSGNDNSENLSSV